VRSYGLYVFDLDDTLLATFRSVTRLHYPLVAERLGLRYRGEESARRSWGRSLEECLPEIFEGNAPAERIVAELARVHAEHPVAPAHGALDILGILRKHERFLAVVTASAPCIMETEIRWGLGLPLDAFDCTYSTVQNGTVKPSPAILEAIFAEYERKRGVAPDPGEVIYVGDSLSDYETAKAHGVDFVAVTMGIHRSEDFLAAGLAGESIFPSLEEAVVPPASHGIVALIQNEAGEYLLIKEARADSPYYGAWSGPHGRCLPRDVIEEETVVRETLEECGLEVRPVRKVFERTADTRIETVAFWESRSLTDLKLAHAAEAREVAAIRWASLEEIRGGALELYTGTYDYFFNHAAAERPAAAEESHG
jgi:phosphoglycolate phosphatase-like HAD superfamily hydrolase/8-oxo-dGTP pyrophosphatase MutT (NUDIX family)